MEVHLTVLNFCWERSYHFDDLSHLNIGVLKNIVLNEPDFAGYRYLYAFYQGLLVPYDDVSLENMVAQNSVIKIDFLLFDRPVSTPTSAGTDVGLRLDGPSLEYVSKWILTHATSHDDDLCKQKARAFGRIAMTLAVEGEEETSTYATLKSDTFSSSHTQSSHAGLVVQHTSDRNVQNDVGGRNNGVAVANDHNRDNLNLDGDNNIEANPGNAAAPPAPAPAPLPVVELPQVQWLQWSLVAKLALVCVLFTYNRRMDMERRLAVAAAALFVYLLQIGAFLLWFKILVIRLNLDAGGRAGAEVGANPVQGEPQLDGNVGADAGANDGGANGELRAGAGRVGAAVGAGAADEGGVGAAGAVLQVSELLLELARGGGVGLPTAPGLLLDVVSFSMALTFSLLPNWHPIRRPF